MRISARGAVRSVRIVRPRCGALGAVRKYDDMLPAGEQAREPAALSLQPGACSPDVSAKSAPA